MTTHNKLYSVDSNSKVRVYYIEQEQDNYRMVSGIDGGKEVRSKWTTAKPKNVGRSNATTGEEQADSEIKSRYTKKREDKYFDTICEAMDSPEGLFFHPMLAVTWEKANAKYKQFPLIADPKLDGMRITEQGVEVISRTGEPIMTVGHIVEELAEFFEDYPEVRLDGELYNHEYKEDFNSLMSIARQSKPTVEDLKIAHAKLEFHVYDCYDESDPLMTAYDRKVWLRNNLQDYEFVKYVDFVWVNNQAELDVVKEQNLINGYEGTMTREPNSIYENKRSNWLLKHKDFITEEFKVHNIVVGKGNRSGIAGTVEVVKNGKIVGCGIRGSHEYCKNMLIKKDEYIGKLATIRHFGETPDGSLRFPVCIDINRPDV
jgi:ATP-dependent DNA ligase